MASKRKQPARQPAKARPWRLFFFGGLVLTACLLYWGLPALARWRAAVCEQQQRLLLADDWHQWGTFFGADTADDWMARACLARKLARDKEHVACLVKARDRGAAPRALEIEVILAEAQRGDLTRLRLQLNKVLQEASRADEVGNAYAEGCLISYQLDEALAMLDVWQADYPRDGRPHLLRGRMLEHRTNMDGAEQEFRQALEKQPTYAAAAYNLATVLVAKQKPEAAIPYYRACARDLGSPVPGLVGEAQCLRLLKRLEEARQCLVTAERADPDRAQQGFRLVGESRDTGAAKLQSELGQLAAATNDHARAVEHLEKASKLAPLDWRIRYQLALSQRQVGQIDTARENLKQVEDAKAALATCDRLFDQLRHDPGNVSARLHIGQVFLKHLSENQGLVWLNSVVDIDPNNAEAHRLLAEYFESHLAERPDNADRARMHRRRAISATPASPPTTKDE